MRRAKPLPPQMAAAFDRLKQAFDGPVPPATGWPFVNPPGIQQVIDDAARAGAKPGAKSKVTTPLIGRLVRMVEEGTSIRLAAKRLGIAKSVAYDILNGKHAACVPDVLIAAGIDLNAAKRAGRRANVSEINSGQLPEAPVAPAPIEGPNASGAEPLETDREVA